MADHRPSLTKRASAVARVARGVPGNLPIPNPLERRTALGRVSEVTYATVPRVQDAVVNAGYKLFPDTRAAKTGTSAEPAEAERQEEGTAEQTFARVTRGVHW